MANAVIFWAGNPVEYEANVAEYFGVITDITARRQSEDAVRVAQADLARVSRATTVGQLTASIAHEINQPLMSIVANAGASLRWLSREPAMLGNARASLEEIISEGERAGNIIRGLQALTRNQTSGCTRINLHHLVYHIVALAQRAGTPGDRAALPSGSAGCRDFWRQRTNTAGVIKPDRQCD
jgi:C4-dicarboxylate-specific signal transduction histidine kinase